jgi:methylglyoxal synthase
MTAASGTTGPFGGDQQSGDQQIGARIADGEIDLLRFSWDPMEPRPRARGFPYILAIDGFLCGRAWSGDLAETVQK